MTEQAFQNDVIRACETFGLITYHVFDSRRSVAGFPDLVIVGASGVLWRELKTATGRVSPAQKFWLAALSAAGMDADVWRPEDWPDRITRELRALGRVTVERPVPSQAELRKKLLRGTRK